MFKIGNEMHYTADEVLVKYEEFANRIDSVVGNISATELNNEIKEFMDDYMGWGDILFGAANFLEKGTGFILEDGSYLDEVVEKQNLDKHCAVLKAGYDYYSEAWFDKDEDCIHDDNDKVYKLKMAYIKELEKYAKEDEEIWVGYAEKRTEMTDYQHLEDYRSSWIICEKGLTDLYTAFMKSGTNKDEIDGLIKQFAHEIVTEFYMPSVVYGNIFASDDFQKQMEVVDEKWDDCITYGFNYYFDYFAFVQYYHIPEFYEEAKKLLKMYYDTTPEEIENTCEEWKIKYEKELEKL